MILTKKTIFPHDPVGPESWSARVSRFLRRLHPLCPTLRFNHWPNHLPSAQNQCLSGKRLLLLLAFTCPLELQAFDEAHPESDPARGDALVAAVKAGNADALKALLRPVDRTASASFVATENTKDRSRQPLSNLLSHATDGLPNPCDIVLLDYGIGISPRLLSREKDFTLFKEHYPQFTTTLGRACLAYSAREGNNDMLANLLSIGVAPEASDLVAAVENNHGGAVKRLVSAGVSKETKSKYAGKDLSLEEIARKNMFFAVLDALGVAEKYAGELRPFREGRPGNHAARFAGHWQFKKDKVEIGLMLEPDGSGFIGDLQIPYDPILWKEVQSAGKTAIRLDQVPGAYHQNPYGPYEFPASGSDIYLPGKASGLVQGVRRDLDSDQREALQRSAKAKTYTGPTGEWRIDLTNSLDDVPAEEREQQRERLKTVKLTIAKDGQAALIQGTKTVRVTAESTEQEDQLRLTPETTAPLTAKGSDNWNRIRISIPGDVHVMEFVRKTE